MMVMMTVIMMVIMTVHCRGANSIRALFSREVVQRVLSRDPDRGRGEPADATIHFRFEAVNEEIRHFMSW